MDFAKGKNQNRATAEIIACDFHAKEKQKVKVTLSGTSQTKACLKKQINFFLRKFQSDIFNCELRVK